MGSAAHLVLVLALVGRTPASQSTTRPVELGGWLEWLHSGRISERLEAARRLGRFRPEPRIHQALTAALQRETDPGVRFEIIRSLVKLGDRSAWGLLRTYCLRPFWNIDLIAAHDLLDAGDTGCVEFMIREGLANPDAEVRSAVLQALRLLQAPETPRLLEQAINSQPGIAEAAHLLAYLKGPAAQRTLLNALRKPGRVHYGAARGLAVIANPELVAELVRMLYRRESAAGAAHALGLIGGPRAVTALFNAVEDKKHPEASVQAALAIMRQSFGYGVRGVEQRWPLERWQRWWRNNHADVGGFENVTIPLGLFHIKGVGHRIAWGDFNGDGYEDLLISGRYLLRNEGGKRFVDITLKAGIYRETVAAAAWADYNNDGRLDFYAASRQPGTRDSLWRNQGDGTFVDVALDAGPVSDPNPSEAVAWADFDNDGNVDLYVANGADRRLPGHPPTHDRLWRNQGDGTFRDVSRSSGIGVGQPRTARGVAWADFDNDGDLDCFVANNRFEPNRLWLNNGDGTFVDVATKMGVAGRAHDLKGRKLFGRSLGCAWADFDNDGWLDLFVANVAPPDLLLYCDKSNLFHNRGLGGPGGKVLLGFRDIRPGTGITYEQTHAECAWGDYDNDGDLDLVITSTFWGRRSYLYRNLGNGVFEDVTWVTGTRVLNGGGCAWADFDRDGRLDLAIAGNFGVRLLRNITRNRNKWLQVELVGRRSNRAAIGARVTVSTAALRQIREVSGGHGTGCQDSLVQHFGLGPNPGPITVRIRWPSGIVQVLRDVKPNRRIRIVEQP